MNHKTEKTPHKKPFKKYTKNRSQNVKIVPQKVLDRTNGTRATLIAKKQSLRENFRTSVHIFFRGGVGGGVGKKMKTTEFNLHNCSV